VFYLFYFDLQEIVKKNIMSEGTKLSLVLRMHAVQFMLHTDLGRIFKGKIVLVFN